MASAPASVSPLEAIAGALETAAAQIFAERRIFAGQRQAIISANPDLQERELLKLASLTSALAAALSDRGVSEPGASLAAESGVAVFKTAFAQWLSQGNERALAELIRPALADLKAVVIE